MKFDLDDIVSYNSTQKLDNNSQLNTYDSNLHHNKF